MGTQLKLYELSGTPKMIDIRIWCNHLLKFIHFYFFRNLLLSLKEKFSAWKWNMPKHLSSQVKNLCLKHNFIHLYIWWKRDSLHHILSDDRIPSSNIFVIPFSRFCIWYDTWILYEMTDTFKNKRMSFTSYAVLLITEGHPVVPFEAWNEERDV